MIMSADSNMGFHGSGVFPSSFYNQHVVSFQSGGMNSAGGAVPGMMNGSRGMSGTTGMMNGSRGMSGTTGMILPGNSGIITSASPTGSSSNIMLDHVPGLKHDTGLAVDWSFEEMAILRAGLVKFVNEHSIMKYVKIAALLPDKTVRDVALRCRWMIKENGKRRKTEEYFAGKKIKDRKEKMVDCSSKASIHSIPPNNMAAYSFMMSHANQNNRFSLEVPVIDGVTWQLLDENARVLNQITANLATFKIQDNVDLFCQTRNTIAAILNCMNETPGIMSQMPPLPVLINEDLVNTILPGTSQGVMFGSPTGIHLKQEPRC